MGYPYFPHMEARCEKVLENIEKAKRTANSRMTSAIQSYDYRDNEHYEAMLALEEVLQQPLEGDGEDLEELYAVLKECFKGVARKQAKERSASVMSTYGGATNSTVDAN